MFQSDGNIRIRQGTVDSVRSDGDLNVSFVGSEPIPVPGFAGFIDREASVGQTVHVLVMDAGMLVLGPSGPDRPWPTVPEPEPMPPWTEVSWGQGAPSGTGWITLTVGSDSSRVWGKDLGDGRKAVHYERPAATAPPSTKPVPTATSTIRSTDWAAWRDGSRSEQGGGPRQSRYASSLGYWSGAWYFPSLAGLAGDRLRLTLERSDASNGVSGGARVRLFLTSSFKPGSNTPPKSDPWSPGTLSQGQKATWTMPEAWEAAFRSGAARSIVCYSDTESESIIFLPTATITND